MKAYVLCIHNITQYEMYSKENANNLISKKFDFDSEIFFFYFFLNIFLPPVGSAAFYCVHPVRMWNKHKPNQNLKKWNKNGFKNIIIDNIITICWE